MDNAYISAIAALAGSGIGAVASFATTWLTQDAQVRAQRFAQAMTRRERLYGEFIEEASKLFADSLAHQLDDPSKFVRLYALVGRLRLPFSCLICENRRSSSPRFDTSGSSLGLGAGRGPSRKIRPWVTKSSGN